MTDRITQHAQYTIVPVPTTGLVFKSPEFPIDTDAIFRFISDRFPEYVKDFERKDARYDGYFMCYRKVESGIVTSLDIMLGDESDPKWSLADRTPPYKVYNGKRIYNAIIDSYMQLEHQSEPKRPSVIFYPLSRHAKDLFFKCSVSETGEKLLFGADAQIDSCLQHYGALVYLEQGLGVRVFNPVTDRRAEVIADVKAFLGAIQKEPYIADIITLGQQKHALVLSERSDIIRREKQRTLEDEIRKILGKVANIPVGRLREFVPRHKGHYS